MRKTFSFIALTLAVSTVLLVNAIPAMADLAPPTPATNTTVFGTVTLFDNGVNSAGTNLIFTSCQGTTTITVRNAANTVVLTGSVSGTGGQGAPIPLTLSWTTETVPNGVYTVTATNLKRPSLCIGSGTTVTTTRTLTVTNVAGLAYGGDTSAPIGGTALVKATLTDQSGVAPPAGTTVTFAMAGGTTQNATTNAAGVAQITNFPVTAPLGSAPITVSYAGTYFTAKTIVQPFTVVPDPTTTTVVSSQNPSTFGQATHFTATVGAVIGGTPTGSVQFRVDGILFGPTVTLVGGVATSGNTSSLTAGTHPVTATYSPTGNFAGSVGSATQTVNKASTTTSVSSSFNPSVFGQSIEFTATVLVNSPGAGTPTGFVTFQQNSQPVGGPVPLQPDGTATSDAISIIAASPTSYPIKATYSGDANFNGSTVTAQQTVNKANTATSVSSSSSPSVFGQSVSFTSTVVAVAPGAGTPTGTVTFTVDNVQLGSPMTLSASGQATSASTAGLSPGAHTVKVEYSGDSNFNASTIEFTQSVDQAATTTSVSSSVNPSVFGQGVTFTASVAVVAPGAGTPTGTVTFTVDSIQVGSPVTVVGGSATSDAIASLAVGGHTVVADYSGDSNFSGSSDTLVQTVNKAATSTAVTSSVNPSVFGQPVTFDATVTVTAPGVGTPSGTVSFFDGATLLDTQPLAGIAGSGTASFTSAALSVGTHTISAVYSGDGSFQTSSGNVTQTVNQAQSSTDVAANGPIVQGQPVAFTATVAAVGPGAGIPTGTVQFALNGAPQGGPVALDAAGQATSAPINGLTPGNFRVTAVYSGDTNFLTSNGGVGQVVNPASPTISLAATPNPAAYGAPVTLTATVVVPPPAVGQPSGTVAFYDGDDLVGTSALDSSGHASLILNSFAVGSHSFSAEYLGDFNFAGATSAAVAHTVLGDPTTTALSATPNPSVFNAPVTLKATVTPGVVNPAPIAGTVSFFDGANLLGTVAVVNGAGNATATLVVSNLAAGSHSLSATYSGTPVYGASSSPHVTQTVNKAPTSMTTSRNNAALTATLTTPIVGGLGGQTLVFKTGSTTICTVTTAANGTAGCTATTSQKLAITLNGSYTVTYAGNASYLSSSATGH